MTTTGLHDLVTGEGDDGTMHPAEQLWTPGEDAAENGFIVHSGMHVTGIDDPTPCARRGKAVPIVRAQRGGSGTVTWGMAAAR
jgi:hypothetical protein